nr:hypothetical protein BaRGS_027006 [Batillaria attramentaria]
MPSAVLMESSIDLVGDAIADAVDVAADVATTAVAAAEEGVAKIQTFLNTCLRRIFNIRWPEKIRNEELWERTGQEPVAKQILRRKWGWIGHTLRKPASSTTRKAQPLT